MYTLAFSLENISVDISPLGIFPHPGGHKEAMSTRGKRPLMDTPVLISHKTAWLVHHAPQDLVKAVAAHDYEIGESHLSTRQRLDRIRQALIDCGIPSDMLKNIDIAVAFPFERVRASDVTCHVLGQNLPHDHIEELTPGIFICDEAFTFVCAAEWLSGIEYLEYGYEVCGDYRMGFEPPDSYNDQPATTSKSQIAELLDRSPGKPGAARARRAIRHIYDHSASPMESASAIAFSLPTSEGGMGIRGIELNKQLEIPDRLWHCTKARTLRIDTLITCRRKKLGIEYKGGFHDEAERKGADAEREAVLGQMGYRIISLTSVQFCSQLAFHRSMNSIREALGMPRRTDAEYQRKQDKLRRTLIRNWKKVDDSNTSDE